MHGIIKTVRAGSIVITTDEMAVSLWGWRDGHAGRGKGGPHAFLGREYRLMQSLRITVKRFLRESRDLSYGEVVQLVDVCLRKQER